MRGERLFFFVILASCNGLVGVQEDPDSPEPPRSSDASPGSQPPAPLPEAPSEGTKGQPPAVVAKPCDVRRAAPAPLRRLIRSEYDTTIRDLLGIGGEPSAEFPPDEEAGGFSNNAAVLTVSPLLARKYMETAERLAATAVASSLATLVPCDPARGDAACGEGFITTWGQRAWRRPLTATERASLNTRFKRALTEHGFAEAVRLTIATMLQAPQFLYRLESPAPADGSLVRLSPWETASRLSYLFWGRMPDEALFTAAASGGLDDDAGVAAQAARLLADPRVKRTVNQFMTEWLEVGGLKEVEKDRSVYPAWVGSLRPLMRKELEAFVDDVFWNGSGTLASLLTTAATYADSTLASFYGLPAPAQPFGRVSVDPAERGGLLTGGAWLVVHAKPNQTDPVVRGMFVRDRLLCAPPAPPPPGLEIKPPDLDPRLTTRERFAAHQSDPQCSGCHRLLDPIGLGFEKLDAIGRVRRTENGKPVDDRGELVGTDVDGPFRGAVELAGRLAKSEQVSSCMLLQWFRFAYGRAETEHDACSLQQLREAHARNKGDLRKLLIALTQTDAFLYRAGGVR